MAGIAIVRQTAPTSSIGVQDYTHADVSHPYAALFFAGATTTDGSTASDAVLCVGMVDRNKDCQAFSYACENGQSNSDTASEIANDTCVYLLDPTDTSNALVVAIMGSAFGAEGAWLPNGIRINWVALGSAYPITCVIFYGEGGNSSLDVVAYPGLSTTTDITSLGFQPNLWFTMTTGGNGALRSDAHVSFGCAVEQGGSITQACACFFSDDNEVSSSCTGFLATDYFVRKISNASIGNGALELSSPDSSGYSVTGRVVGDSYNASILALKLPPSLSKNLSIASFPTSTGNWTHSGLGILPAGVIMGITEVAITNSVATNRLASLFGYSAFTAADAGSGSGFDKDGESTMVCNTMSDDMPVNIYGTNSGGVEKNVNADFVSFSSGQFVLNFNEVFFHSAKAWCLALGETAEPNPMMMSNF